MPGLQPAGKYDVLGRYADLVARGVVYSAYAIVTAPAVYTTATATGGPLIFNPVGSQKVAHLLAVGFSTSVVTTVAGGLGIGVGSSSNPTSTTSIDLLGNLNAGGSLPTTVTASRIGTVSNAPSAFFPIAQVHTGALTVDTTGWTWTDVGGIAIAGAGRYITFAGTATLSTLVVQIGAIFAEL